MSDQLQEVEVVDLVEAAVIADFMLDSKIRVWLPQPHDYDGMKGGDDEQPDGNVPPEKDFTVTVSAEDRGDFKGAPGYGLKLVGVTVEIQKNVGGDDTSELSAIGSRVSDRLPATQLKDKSRHEAFSNQRLRVLGIMSNETERRLDVDLTRTRIIAREFLCAQIA